MGQAEPTKKDVPRICPIPENALPDGLKRTIERLQADNILSSTTAVRIWAHRPKLAVAWLDLLQCFYAESTLDERLRELIRLRIAAVTNCEACKISRKSDTVTASDIACISSDDTRFSSAERAAMNFAAGLAGDHDTIDDETFKDLEAAFSEEQIVEINMFAALMMAGGRMTYAQKAY